MRHNSERVPGKNYRDLGGVPLFHHIVRALIDSETVDEVVIDTDSDVIIDSARRSFPDIVVLRRPDHLRDGNIAMNDVLINVLNTVEADVILQTHSTNPFLKSQTIDLAVRAYLEAEPDVTGIFGVTRLTARLWRADNTPINHDPAVLIRTQDLEPVFLENSCFYVFSPDTLLNSGSRLGGKPKMLEVSDLESVDIDNESDFQLAMALKAVDQP